MIRIKPHHFVDIITALGGGQKTFQPHHYGHAVHTAAEEILRRPDILLRIELGADDICAPCCHNVAGRCDDTIDTSYRPAAPKSKGEWNLLIDRRWCDRLGLKQDDQLTAVELCRRIQQCLPHLPDIYREIPADRTAERAGKLAAGLAEFLSSVPDDLA